MAQLTTYIAQSKDNKLILKSSSGGMFAELAKYVLSQNGIVFGCAMERVENGFDVKHIYIEDEKDLYKLQGSKYVQSNLGDSIKQAKEFLDNGKLVLFSGTPCQIAGLKNFLKQDYDNLITVDLSCEGTPSLKIFNDYIKYLEDNVVHSKIVDFKFRSKKYFGWGHSGFVAIYKDKDKFKKKLIAKQDSSYYSNFLKCCILQERCFSCKYTGIDRLSDITIADAWGVQKEYPDILKKKFKTNKGISLVLINSNKGKNYLEAVKSKFVINEVDVKKMRKYNHPLRHPSIKSKDRDAYMEVYSHGGYNALEQMFRTQNQNKKSSFYDKVKMFTPKFIKTIIRNFYYKNEPADCLLFTMFTYPNYGSLITAYALQKTIEKLGYNTKIIYNGDLFGYNKTFARKWLKTTKKVITVDEYNNLNYVSNTFILGSDNLINYKDSALKNVAQALLNFVNSDKKKLMISGSIGSWDGTTENSKEKEYIKYLLNRFDYISTREEHGKQVFETKFDCQADWINDPVFYLDKKDYIDIANTSKQNYKNKIMQYILYPTDEKQNIVDFCSKKRQKDVIKFEANSYNINRFSDFKNKNVEDWMSAIINSDLIITDSFHCVAFSLMFNKPFICVKNNNNAVRFLSLFKRLGIDILMVETADDIKNFECIYDTEIVNNNIENIKEYALEKIEENLLKPKTEKTENIQMSEYNKRFIYQNIPWYQKNKLFYYSLIRRFISPIKKSILYINEWFDMQKNS